MVDAEAWKYPLAKQSFNCVYTFELEIGMEADRKVDNPRDGIVE